ncbi:hypothetical protein A2935_03880 [Candidatus Wolfebacteria bacterium RIFCSPLOWO2_01_FULL_47_17b]|uniref:HEPN domain-containing protein n=1 Tax=Candidatus Wolfebacteria bacterium RIFCSPLOWO2_01_FULL_47_17b TaxID=1802558 RepID=A0A1F8DWU9_9BACT|nr:MAG: hypothetical protein A2935_03880 [Candidatus Wolfebacteria bacterium RIFCSPLOWO2_01_FULL_47_17b]
MPDEIRGNYRAWIHKATEDELSLNAILKDEAGSPSTACFLSQQTAEKLLKGLLVFHNKDFPKVHDLLELETLLLGIEPDIAGLHKDLTVLNRYYIEARYPGEYPEFNFIECREGREAAGRIKEFVLAKTSA